MAVDTPLEDAAAEGLRVIEAACRDNLEVFLLGGVAIRIWTPSPLFARDFNDIDIVTTRRQDER